MNHKIKGTLTVKRLKEFLSLHDDDMEITIRGCYASEGFIEEISERYESYPDKGKKVLVFDSDICSGD